MSVRSQIEVRGDLRVTSLSRCLDEANVNREILKALLEKGQGELVNEPCNRKYSIEVKVRSTREQEPSIIQSNY